MRSSYPKEIASNHKTIKRVFMNEKKNPSIKIKNTSSSGENPILIRNLRKINSKPIQPKWSYNCKKECQA